MVRKSFKEAMDRLFNRVYVCKKCKSKIRADYSKIKDKKVKCRKCQSKSFRPKRKEKKV
jgi:ribosomal protein L40E